MNDPAIIDAWLKTLEAALAPLPDAERRDIIDETRGHLQERLDAGLPAGKALHGFGDARGYAQGFIDDHSLTTALNSKRIFLMIKTLFTFAGRSLVATLGLFSALLFGSIALGAVVSIVLKTIRPDMVGLWVGPADHVVLGTIAHHEMAHEIAGNWIYLLLAAMVIVGAILARYSLSGALHMIRGKRAVKTAAYAVA